VAQEKIFPTPVDWDELYPGRFLKASDFKGKQVTLKISGIRLEELIGDKGAQIKGIISFDKTEKQLALNKTNGICLKEMFGKKVQEWVGKRVTLFPTVWNGEDAIRIYGSPEIEADKEITISLPRKRPFAMTMHSTRAAPPAAGSANGVAPAANGAAGGGKTLPPSAQSIETIRAAQTLDALAKARKSVWGLYAAANADVPLDVDAAANEHREALEQRAQE